MQAIKIDFTESGVQELDELYRSTRLARMRTRVQMLLLHAEQGFKAGQIAQVVRESVELLPLPGGN